MQHSSVNPRCCFAARGACASAACGAYAQVWCMRLSCKAALVAAQQERDTLQAGLPDEGKSASIMRTTPTPRRQPSQRLPAAAAGAHRRRDCVVCVHLPDANSCIFRAGAGSPDGLPGSHGHGGGGGLPCNQQPLLRVSGPVLRVSGHVHSAPSSLTSRGPWPSALPAVWPQRNAKSVQRQVLRRHSLWDTVSAQLRAVCL